MAVALHLFALMMFHCMVPLEQKNFSGSNTDGSIVYHGCFELFLESLGKTPIAADIIIFGIIKDVFLFNINNGMLFVLIRISSIRQF